MAVRRLKVTKKASCKIEAQSIWYYQHRDRQFVKTMLKNIADDIELLLSMPTIGKKIETRGKHEYRVFVSRKKCLIFYWYDDKILSVTNILFTDTHTPRLF